MGGSTHPFHSKINKKTGLFTHPNFELPSPEPGEDQIKYALRCAAHLVSPPQDPDESYEIECIEAAKNVLSLEDDIKAKWNAHGIT